MPLYDFFCKVFGPYEYDRGPGQPGFRNPIWEDDADDDDDELDDDFRHSLGSPFGFRIFNGNAIDIHEQQMYEIIKTLHSSLFGSDLLRLPESDERFHKEIPSKHDKGSQKYLKPWVDNTEDNNVKKDSDVDGSITAGELEKLFPSENEAAASSKIHLPQKLYGHSVITRIFRSSDGRLEEEKRVCGSDGKEEVSLTRQIGDQKYKVTTKKDSQTGITDTTEELVNLDEGKLDDFNKKWANKFAQPSINDNNTNDKSKNRNFINIYSKGSEFIGTPFGNWFK